MTKDRTQDFGWFHRIARGVDIYRLVPRIALGFYMWQMWHVAEWAMGQTNLSTPQTVFVSTVYGAFPFLLNFYMQQGNSWVAPGISPPAATVTATATSAPPAVTKGS